jgi:predicted Zn-dependent protease
MGTGLADVEREQRYRELEVARRLLREERRRIQYDAILQALWRGMVDQIRLGALQQIQESILAEMHEGQSEQLSAEQVAATLQQAEGYIVAGMPREALPLLRATIAAAPDQITAHGMFAHAILASDDPLSLGAPLLRQALASLEKAPASEDRDGRVALCRGLIAREEQRLADADTQLRHATRLSSQKSVAWRALAAIALARADYSAAIEHAQAAFAADHADERALLMIVAASMRAGRREQAREAAAQVAQLRGGRWNVQAVLDEMRS